MAHGDISGRAVTSSRRPESFGVCDRCGFWFQLNKLNKQQEFYGTSLSWTGYLTCQECTDQPQAQLIPIILPPDPRPVQNPRPEAFRADFRLSGFTQYFPFQPIYAEQSKADVLAAIAALSGVPTPSAYVDFSNTVRASNASQWVLPADPARTWVLFYNPSNPQLQVSINATAIWGNPANLIIGPGEAVLASNTTGALATLNIIGLIPGVPFFAFGAPPGIEYITTEDGQILTTESGQPITTG